MIPILNLTRQYEELKAGIDEALIRVAASGHYILGPEVKAFEEEMAHYLGVKHVVGCANGTDALWLALRALKIGPGDEVITTPFTFVATSEAILRTGARPVFVDIEPDTFNINPALIEAAVTPRTKAILPVHLYGQPANMDVIMRVANAHHLAVIEDCAQSIGSEWQGRKTGTIGDIGCFSFFPSKNLGCMGDGGMCATNDDELAERLRMLRAHGSRKRYYHEEEGINSRLDEMQAAVLRVKLPHLDQWNHARRQIAQRYNELLQPMVSEVETPVTRAEALPVFHQYTLKLKATNAAQLRGELQTQLQEAGIQTMVYYPIPLYRQALHSRDGYNPTDYPVSEELTDRVLSLPMFPELRLEEQNTVVESLCRALGKKSPALQK